MKQKKFDVVTCTSTGTEIDVLSVNNCTGQQLMSILQLAPPGTEVKILISEITITTPHTSMDSQNIA